MSKQSYINGFCKQAAARGVDPNALAEFVKRAGLWDDIKNTVSNAWEKVPSNYKGLVGGGVGTAGGALGGALLGKLFGFGAGKGALLGGGLGGIGGALYGSHVGNQENIAALNEVLADQKSQSQREMDALVDANAEAIGKLQGDHKKQLEKIVADHKSEMDKANAGFEKERKGLNDQISDLDKSLAAARAMRGLGTSDRGKIVKEIMAMSPEKRQALLEEIARSSSHGNEISKFIKDLTAREAAYKNLGNISISPKNDEASLTREEYDYINSLPLKDRRGALNEILSKRGK